jgi:cyclase
MRVLSKMLLMSVLVSGTAAVSAQQDFSNVQIVPHALGDGLYYLEGSGGNIGVSVGDDGVFLIDDQYAPLTEKIIAAIGTLSDQPIRFLINTHYHPDHVGGNQNLGQAGVVIISNENVRTRLAAGFTNGDLDAVLSDEQRVGLPVITYADSVDLHLNGHDIHAFHVAPAHTDGDSFVYFRDINLIHTGDVFRTTGYPRVDGNANGSYHGIMAGYQTLLDISDANTRFLPGHGVVSDRNEVASQLQMFTTIRDRVKAGMDAGMTLEQIQASKPTAEYDARWSGGNASAGDDLVAVIHGELRNM